MKLAILFFSAALSACGIQAAPPEPAAAKEPKKMIVAVPVADVRAKRSVHSKQYVQDPDQETQVVAGEPVLVHEIKGGWARVECPHQPEFTHNNRWEGYPGWVDMSALTDDLSKEIPLKPDTRPDSEVRKDILAEAARHIGTPYLWGGRSIYSPTYRRTVSGVDCSGLVNWSFRQSGFIVPRDAHEQFMKARRIEPAQMVPGDLIFLAKADRADRVVHVAFYAGQGELIEAPQSGQAVRRISLKERFGMEAASMRNGMTVEDRVIYFGTLFE